MNGGHSKMRNLTPIPDADKLIIKDSFKKRYEKLTDFKEFMKYNLSFLERSFRVNTLKITVEALTKRMTDAGWKLTPIPWCKEGFWIEYDDKLPALGNTIEHGLGYIYIQEAASMIPPIVLSPKEESIILDCCASPGSKTTELATIMKNTGLIIANDVTGNRLASLGANLQRMGIFSAIITQQRAEYIKGKFQNILLDAPCSGTGNIRNSLNTLKTWNPDTIRRMSGLQRKLLLTMFENLESGGTMTYSTCSIDPEEDEAVIDFLVRRKPEAIIEEIEFKGKRSPAIEEFEGFKYSPEIKKCLRIWPQDNNTEGFFAAKIRKRGE